MLSPFDTAAVLSVDGMGDFVSTVTAIGKDTALKKISEVFYPHSLGFLYNALTIYLGFPNYGDEYKVMGLAPYGEPEYVDEFRKIIRPKGDTFELNLDYFTHVQKGIAMSWDGGNPRVEAFHSPLLEQRLGPARKPGEELEDRHENLAASLQRVTEEVIFHLLDRLHQRTRQRNIVLVGGCAMNSVANGKVTRETPFERLYVPVGAADNGTAIGAAFHVWNQKLKQPRTFRLQHGYWGDEFDKDACRKAIEQMDLPFSYLEDTQLLDHVVDAIADGKIVGWYRGPMEFGARALGRIGGTVRPAAPQRSDPLSTNSARGRRM